MSNKYSWIDVLNGESEQIGSFNEPVKFAGQELESLSTPPTKHQMGKKKKICLIFHFSKIEDSGSRRLGRARIDSRRNK